MLRIETIGPNQTLLYTKKVTILFCYDTPVAAKIHNHPMFDYVRTEKKYSNTTTKHINRWLFGKECKTVPQSAIDSLLDE